MRTAAALAQSVQTRLMRTAQELGVDPNLILTRYAAERLLYRLSRSRHADLFVLKGAMLLVVWLNDLVRPTRGIDLLGFGDLSDTALTEIFREVATADVEPDGVMFDSSTISVARLREDNLYGGIRVTLRGSLGRARLHVQIDIGIGDAVYPKPEQIEYPSLLDLPRPKLRAYCPETAIAEKLHAMVILGSVNSRMRDFFDVRTLAQREPFDGQRLAGAVRETFERRETAVPARPLALTRSFANVKGKRDQWSAFLGKNGLREEDFAVVINDIASFLLPVVSSLVREGEFDKVWLPGGPWS